MATETGMSKLHVKAGGRSDGESPAVEVLVHDAASKSRAADPDPEEELPQGARREALLQALGPELTLLAETDSLQGRMVISGDGRLLGMFSGDVECTGDLVIGPVAEITATIRGHNVTIAGSVRGNVVCQGRLKIASTGRLEGDARVGALVVDEGGVHHGVIRVHPEGVPEDPDGGAGELTTSTTEVVSPTPAERVRKFWGEFF